MRLNAVPRGLADSVNTANSALLAVVDFQNNDDRTVAFHATQVSLQCSGKGNPGVPDETIRRIAFSQIESERHSLVYWILMELKHDKGRDPQLLDSLLQPIGFEVDQQTILQNWFLAAAASQRPTLSHLTELQSALRNTGPVFGRQCAKYFLQMILSDSLSEYDPAAPNNRNALSSITRKMRAWQQSNP